MLLLDANSPTFSYVVHALHYTLLELGIPNNFTNNTQDTNATYITCTAHEGHPLPPRYIAYNFEQLTTNKRWPPSFFNRLKHALMVWDFSRSNILILRKHNITAIHLPLGYAPSIEHSLPTVSRDIPVMFVGAMNLRRSQVLQQFAHSPAINVTIVRAHSNALVPYYARSKISLNIHYYEGRQLLEIHRIIPLIVHRVWVVSEHSCDSFLDEQYFDLLDFHTTDEMKEACQQILQREDYNTVVEKRYQHFRHNCSYKQYISSILDKAI